MSVFVKSGRDLVELYARCFRGVKNEMLMRTNADQLSGTFLRDDQVVEGYLHAIAWVFFTQEDATLHFPESYGREVIVELTDIWGNVRAIYNKPGNYHMTIPSGSAGIVLARVRCFDGSEEREYQQAFDVLDDLSINDLDVGANDYEDSLTLIPAAGNLKNANPADLTGKEFFALANVIWTQNPFPWLGSGKTEALFVQTGRMTAAQLDQIKKEAVAKYKLV